MKKILIISEDPKLLSSVKEILKAGHEIEKVSSLEEGFNTFKESIPDLLILDYDLKKISGREALRQLKRANSRLKVIMVSSSPDISAAVTVTKMGAADFILKPLEMDRFRTSVEKLLGAGDEEAIMLSFRTEDSQWLAGESEKNRGFLRELENAVRGELDILLIGEKGIDKKLLAEIIHRNGIKKRRKLITLDLLSFEKEATESHFWVATQELLSETIGISQKEEDLCGTLYLENFEGLGASVPHFQLSLLEFLKNRRSGTHKGRIDREIKVIITVEDEEKLIEFEKQDLLSKFHKIRIPALRERKEDLPILINLYLAKFAEKFGKAIRLISTDALNLIMVYDWPGNIEELTSWLEVAVLNSSGSSITLRDLPIDLNTVLAVSLKKILTGQNFALERAKEKFEKELISVVLEKTNWDEDKVAKILDLPKTYLTSRIQSLGLKRARV